VTPTYKLHELAEEAGVAPRTVRYYVQRGLLPAPDFRGKDTAYGREHLLRLQAIKRLQQAHLPLDEIQNRLANVTEAELLRLSTSEAPGYAPFEEPRATATGENHGHPYRTPGGQESKASSVVDAVDSLSTVSQSTARIYQLAPGVELLVRDGLPAPSHALVREILNRYLTITDDKDADR